MLEKWNGTTSPQILIYVTRPADGQESKLWPEKAQISDLTFFYDFPSFFSRGAPRPRQQRFAMPIGFHVCQYKFCNIPELTGTNFVSRVMRISGIVTDSNQRLSSLSVRCTPDWQKREHAPEFWCGCFSYADAETRQYTSRVTHAGSGCYCCTQKVLFLFCGHCRTAGSIPDILTVGTVLYNVCLGATAANSSPKSRFAIVDAVFLHWVVITWFSKACVADAPLPWEGLYISNCGKGTRSSGVKI